MTWIPTIPYGQAQGRLREVYEAQRASYPSEYLSPAMPGGESIVAAHSLLPEVMHHIFAAYGALLSTALPLSRRLHELIATLVSATNHCVY
jgi:hypothetical protein